MNTSFAETLRRLRTERGLSQQELAKQMYVTRSTVARWESGSRLPDAAMISRLSRFLNVDVNTLMSAVSEGDEQPNVIMVDDRKIILTGALPILKDVMPGAVITGFTRPSEAVEYARANRVALAFLDIEMGKTSGIDLCRTLLEINPRTNVIYLTAYISLALMIFNILPISPLDGSKVLYSFLPEKAYMTLMRYERYGMILLLVLVATHVLGSPLSTATGWVFDRLFFLAEGGFELYRKLAG